MRQFMTFVETGQTVRWRGSRWRVLGEDEGGFLRLVGIDPAVKDLQVTPLVDLERHDIRPDEMPLPELNVEASDRGRWRALHRAYSTSMAGGREHRSASTGEPWPSSPTSSYPFSGWPRPSGLGF